jgi:hypothetical protein
MIMSVAKGTLSRELNASAWAFRRAKVMANVFTTIIPATVAIFANIVFIVNSTGSRRSEISQIRSVGVFSFDKIRWQGCILSRRSLRRYGRVAHGI